MFLDTIARRNPDLVRAAVSLHQAGAIPPNCYVLDLDAVRRNARLIKQAADRAGLRVYPMTKQVGRNPLFVRAVARAGMPKVVCVDWMEAKLLARRSCGGLAGQKAQIGHVGHLVQIPRAEAPHLAALAPEVWTVFNLHKAREAAEAAQRVGRTQDLLLRVVRPGDTFYPTHDGGFALDDIVSAAREIAGYPGVRVVGVTSFPTLLFDPEVRSIYLTPNMETLRLAADRLRRELGLEITQVNAPGTTSAETMQMLADAGATHVEPGHGFTGTTPWHAYADLPEKPAICYLTEVTDLRGSQAYVLGGGLYVDPVIPPYQVRAFVGRDGDQALQNTADADLGSPAGIDYYGLLDCAAGAGDELLPYGSADRKSARVEIGDSVVFGFRAQAFVTRAHVAVVRGISRRSPVVAGTYDASGKKLGQPTGRARPPFRRRRKETEMTRATVCLCIAACLLTFWVAAGLAVAATSAGSASVRVTRESARSRVALNPQPEPPIFRVMSVAELRSLKLSLSAVKIGAPPRPIPDPAPIPSIAGLLRVVPGPGSQPVYSSANGVVLDAVHPLDNASTSSLLVLGVMYNSELRYHVQYDHPDTVLYQEIPLTNLWTGVSATFRKLPSGEHTYMLTLGHTADPKRVSIAINGQQFGPDKLIANPATSEIRALFTCDAGASGGNLPVFVRFSFADAQVTTFAEFHHLQLAQLD